MRYTSIIFNLEYIVNGWFKDNFTKVGPNLYRHVGGGLFEQDLGEDLDIFRFNRKG